MSRECHRVSRFAADRVFEIGALALMLVSIAGARADGPIRLPEFCHRLPVPRQLPSPFEWATHGAARDGERQTGDRRCPRHERNQYGPARAAELNCRETRAARRFASIGSIDLDRTVGDKPQEATLRPSVRRLVILRTGHREVPFSPDGPLTWAEIDLVRTDVFTPAWLRCSPINQCPLATIGKPASRLSKN